MELENLYWHCFFKLKGVDKISHTSDLNLEQIKTIIIDPYTNQKPIVFKDFSIPTVSNIENITILHTNIELSKIPIENEDIYSTSFSIPSTNNYSLLNRVKKYGSDFTDYFLNKGEVNSFSIDIIRAICERLKDSSKFITQRTRKGKTSYSISDEYDVQDLLQMILKTYFPYAIQEDPIGKIGGVTSSRIDIAIEDIGLLIEIKYARYPTDQEKFLDDFSKDILIYSKWPHLKNFIFFVFNSSLLKDPDEFKRLSGKKRVYENVEFKAYIELS